MVPAGGMTFKARVLHLEFGFFFPPSLPQGEEVEVDENGPRPDENDLRGPRFVLMPGLEYQMQFFRTLVRPTPDEKGAEHLLVSAYGQPFSEQQLVSPAPLLAEFAQNASIFFIVSNREGWAEIFPESAEPSIAVAVAAVKLSYGWDESDPIVVKVGRLCYAVRQQPDDWMWHAERSMG